MHGVSQGDLGFHPRAELGPGEALGWLQGGVAAGTHDDDGVGVDVQAQLDEAMLFARGWLRANFGGIQFCVGHIVGGCSTSALARQQLMPSTRPRALGFAFRASRS